MTDPDLSQTTVMPAVDPFVPPDSYFPPATADSALGYPVSDAPALAAPAVPTLPDALAPTAGPPPSAAAPQSLPAPTAVPATTDLPEPESAPALPYPPPVSTQWGPGQYPAWLPTPTVEEPQPAPPPASHPGAVNCPECGAPGHVDPTRRDAADFCAHCDFPLFWARDRVAPAGPSGDDDDSLRRLPGALGLAVIASVPCPHCNELNLPSAQLCVRCGLSMHVQLAPPPIPPRAPLPPAERPLLMLDEDDEPQRLWIWWVVLIGVFLIAGIALVIAQHWY